MFVASIKVIELAFRSIFVLLVLYALPAREAGQFGLILTLIGFFSFLSGFERYCDFQRVIVGKQGDALNAFILNTLHFFAMNYLFWLPILALLLVTWVEMSWGSVLICSGIAIAEHLSNEAYRVVVVTHQYRVFLIAAMCKNILLVICVVALKMIGTEWGLDKWLALWAVFSLPMMILIAIFLIKKLGETRLLKSAEAIGIRDQYRQSAVHFRIGLLALLSLQADRLIAGKMLPLEQVGDYFKNILCVTAIYQLLGIISHNRVMSRVYQFVRSGKLFDAKKIIQKQIVFNVIMITFLGFTFFIVIEKYFKNKNIECSYFSILLFACFIRIIADYKAMILNAMYRECSIYSSQKFSLIFCLPCSILLAWVFGCSGLICSVLLYSVTYLVMINQVKNSGRLSHADVL